MREIPLVTIITVCYNSEKTIEDTIKSVISQTYGNIEYIIVDGDSDDGTIKIINKYFDKKNDIKFRVISEKDNGLYDAMNKGIDIATGDIIGILNSDDIYVDEYVISNVVDEFNTNNDIDLVYGDLVFVDEFDTSKVVRKWIAGKGSFKYGWIPPHPTVFVTRSMYEKCGKFNINYKIASDYEMLYKFLEKSKANTSYIKRVLVKMRIGGESNRGIKSKIILNKETLDMFIRDKFWFGPITIVLKIVRKIPQIIFKK